MSEEIKRCKRCNRILTNSKSMSSRYGKICILKILEENEKQKTNDYQTEIDLWEI